MERIWGRLLAGLLLLAAGCPRLALAPGPDGGSRMSIRIDKVELRSGRPAWSGAGADAGHVGAFTGDTVVVRGAGWEGLRAELAVGGVVLPTLSSSGELAGQVPDAMPAGELLLLAGGQSVRVGVDVAWLGPGRPRELASVGEVPLQLTVTAGGVGTVDMGALALGGGPESAGLNNVAMSKLLGLTFNLGAAPDPTQDQYLAGVSDGWAPALGKVPPWAVDAGWGRQVEATRAYLGSDGALRVAGLEHAFARTAAGVEHQYRLVTLAGGSPTVPGLRGPLFHVAGAPPRLVAVQALPDAAAGVSFSVLTFPMDDAGAPGGPLPVPLPDRIGEIPVAVGLVPGWALGSSALAGGGYAANVLVTASCSPGDSGGALVVRLFPVQDGTDGGSLGLPYSDAMTLESDGCGPAMCGGGFATGAARSDMPPGMEAVPAVPDVLGEIVSDMDHALVVLPSASASRAGIASASCVVVLPGTDHSEELGAAVEALTAGAADGGVKPTYLQKATSEPTGAAAVLRSATTDLLALGPVDPMVGSTRELLLVRNVVDGMDLPAEHFVSGGYYTTLFGDGSATAFALREMGELVDILGPGGSALGSVSALGKVLAAWPVEGSGKLAMVRPSVVLRTDAAGYVDRFQPLAAVEASAVVLEQARGRGVTAVWGAQRRTDGIACVLRWSVDEEGVHADADAAPLLCLAAAGDSAIPVLVDEEFAVVRQTAAEIPAGSPCAPDGASPGDGGSGSDDVGSMGGQEWLALLRRDAGAPALQALAGSCGFTALAINPRGHRLFARGWNEVGVQVLRLWNLAEPDPQPVDLADTAQFLVPLPSGGTLGFMVDDLFGTRRLECIDLDGGLVPLGAAPFTHGVQALSPDGTVLYAAAPGCILEVNLPVTGARGCPAPVAPGEPSPFTVSRRAALPGTPTQVVLDATGARLVWADAESGVVGVVE